MIRVIAPMPIKYQIHKSILWIVVNVDVSQGQGRRILVEHVERIVNQYESNYCGRTLSIDTKQ